MNREQQLTLIREKCIEANAEILALNFGCELERPGSTRHYRVIEEMGWGGNKDQIWINSVPFGAMPFPRPDEEAIERREITDNNGEQWKIIGRPIRLADVLLTIGQVNIAININGMGAFCKYHIWHGEIELWSLNNGLPWNLRADDLNEQSDECIAFLADLLAGEK
jgi:hypothetical protein